MAYIQKDNEILQLYRKQSSIPVNPSSRSNGDVPLQLPTAFVSAVVGVVDSIVAARENAAKYGYDVSPNRELVALGGSSFN